MAQPWNRNTRFPELIEEMVATYRRKNSDYSDSENDPFRNFRFIELAGTPAFDGVLARLSDKFIRIMNLRKKEKEGREVAVKSEAITDTLLDLANYAIIALVLYEEEQRDKDLTPEPPAPFTVVNPEGKTWEERDEQLRRDIADYKQSYATLRPLTDDEIAHLPHLGTEPPPPYVGLTPEEAMRKYRQAVAHRNLGNLGGSGVPLVRVTDPFTQTTHVYREDEDRLTLAYNEPATEQEVDSALDKLMATI